MYACVLALITVTTTFITPEIAARDQTTWTDALHEAGAGEVRTLNVTR
ncbi:MAG TPA: hypothetical protein VEX66_11930 [Microlunatus sp.]|nr:hypothetical protein [Microlunatus sp.]